MQLEHYKDYRDYLKEVLDFRSQKNPQYSLRSLARDLGISAGQLSDVIGGKKGLSVDRAFDIAEKLNLNTKEAAYFCDLVQSVHSRSKNAKKLARARCESFRTIPEIQAIQLDYFRIIKDWYHYAILELTYVEGFKNDVNWIASKLSITTAQVIGAMERLKRLGLIHEKNGTLIKVFKNIETSDRMLDQSVNKATEQLIEKAREAIYTQNFETRVLENMTMAIDKSRIPEARKMIFEFKNKLCNFLEQGEINSIYAFSSQLFELTQTHKKDRSLQ